MNVVCLFSPASSSRHRWHISIRRAARVVGRSSCEGAKNLYYIHLFSVYRPARCIFVKCLSASAVALDLARHKRGFLRSPVDVHWSGAPAFARRVLFSGPSTSLMQWTLNGEGVRNRVNRVWLQLCNFWARFCVVLVAVCAVQPRDKGEYGQTL